MVRVKSTHSDTEVRTRKKKITALPAPCLVIMSLRPNILKIATGSPGLKKLNKAGTAINNEKSGIKNQVRSKKKPRFMEDNKASKRQSAYI